jgi:hypothetical protein
MYLAAVVAKTALLPTPVVGVAGVGRRRMQG